MSTYNVKYMSRTVIKGQALVDFVVEFTESVVDEGKGIVETMTILISIVPTWEVYTDGVANRKGARVGVILITPVKL